MKKLFKILWNILGVIYFPVYAVFFAWYRITRLLMAFAYLGMLEFDRAKDLFKYTFKNPNAWAK